MSCKHVLGWAFRLVVKKIAALETPGNQATTTISYAGEQRRRCGGGQGRERGMAARVIFVEDGADVRPATPSGKLLLGGATSLIMWGCRHRGTNRAELRWRRLRYWSRRGGSAGRG